jgi:hypothetical protein
MPTRDVLRDHLLALLRGGHMPFDEAVADFPLAAINRRPPQVPYTSWHLLEHLRITQWDIVEFIRHPAHVSPPWPDGYWPARAAQADAGPGATRGRRDPVAPPVAATATSRACPPTGAHGTR